MTLKLRAGSVIKDPYPQIGPSSNEELAVGMQGGAAFFPEVHGHLEGLEREEGGSVEEGHLVAGADCKNIANIRGEFQVHHGPYFVDANDRKKEGE